MLQCHSGHDHCCCPTVTARAFQTSCSADKLEPMSASRTRRDTVWATPSTLSQLSSPRLQPRTPRASLQAAAASRATRSINNPVNTTAGLPSSSSSAINSTTSTIRTQSRRPRPSLLDGRYKSTDFIQRDEFVRGVASVALHGLCAVGRGTTSQGDDSGEQEEAGILGPMRITSELAGQFEAFKGGCMHRTVSHEATD